ncbi:hypothetical protein EPUL_005550, partial [Erysiphe pulchra]
MTVTSPINIAIPKGNAPSYSSRVCHVSDRSCDIDFSMSPVMNSSSIPKYGSSVDSTSPRPISVPNPNTESRTRRDSMAGSLTQGASWDGYSLGSWIRDDVMMTGTSPYAYQLSSFNSSSFLPLLEDKYLRDFACCGSTIPSLHDLLQHYETTHVHLQTPQSLRASYLMHRPRENSRLNNKIESALPTPNTNHQPALQDRCLNSNPQSFNRNFVPTYSSISKSERNDISYLNQQQQENQNPRHFPGSSSPIPNNTSSEIDEMEMDGTMSPLDDLPDTPPRPPHSQLGKRLRQSHFGHIPQLSLDLSSTAMQFPGLRNSQPPTPASAGFGYQNNPTVSSVNTPTLSAQPMSRSQSFTPATSGPGTPIGNDESESTLHNSIQFESMNQKLSPFSYPYSLGTENMGNGYCIDEPAKRLYNPNGLNSLRLQQLAHLNQNRGGLYHNEPILQAQHSLALVNPQSSTIMAAVEEHKPFRCPVIGCEKAYKNQNGLKYHKTHGHSTQQIHDNGDGTYSILNPETSLPFPGTLGMEKEKPYKCDCCTKRYKNLNGLKYHKQHTPSCNPEFDINNHLSATNIEPLAMDVSNLCALGHP